MLAPGRTVRFLLLACVAMGPAVAVPGPALAQGKLEATYTVTLAGIPIGKGTWSINVGETHYNAVATGATTGLLRVFTGGEGTTVAQGGFGGGKLASSTYTANIKSRKKSNETRLIFEKGALKEAKITPTPDDDPERVPVTEAHTRGVVDPMSASLLRVPGNGDLLAPEACNRRLSVFDGRLRYDLRLAYKRMDRVKADKGYAGPVLVCAVYFVPVAGYVPSRRSIKYLSAMRDTEVWLAPITGTRVLAPFRAQGPTPIGDARLEADQFVSVPGPSRASLQR